MDRTQNFKEEDIENNKGISCFAYLGFLFVMPLFAASDSPFARFHANQGLVLMIDQMILIVLILIAHLLAPVVPSVFPIVRTLLLLILYVFSIFSIVFGIVNTLKGKAKELPLIGGTKILK